MRPGTLHPPKSSYRCSLSICYVRVEGHRGGSRLAPAACAAAPTACADGTCPPGTGGASEGDAPSLGAQS